MSNVVFLESESKLQEQAGIWIAKLDRGLSDAERDELQAWLAENERHQNALFELAKVWDQMDVLAEIAGLFPLERRSSLPPRTWRIAAMFALVAVVSGFTFSSIDWPRVAANAIGVFTHRALVDTYQTKVGEQKTVQLPDHSVITLNTDTLVRVNYTDTERKLELVRGEANFKVAKDHYRVFTVKVAENEFKAVGTAFNIRMGSIRGIELTVTEGRVKVIAPVATETVRPENNLEKPVATEIMVDAGKEVVVIQATQTIEPVSPSKMEAALAWQSGALMFDGDPLEQVIQEISRYATTKFVIADEGIKQTPVTGYFKIGDIDGLIAALRANFAIDVDKEGQTVLLTAR
jgi:transmembrane sensor